MKQLENNKIIFSYRMSNIFNNCCTKISYKSRNISEDAKINDELTLSDDDKSIFEANIPFILADIYERILKLSHGITEAYKIEIIPGAEMGPSVGSESGDITVIPEDKIIIFTFVNNNAYNSNVLDVLDVSLYQCLETGSIKAWYDVCGLTTIEQDYNTKYLSALAELSRRIFQLKKKIIMSTLGTISA